MQIPPFWRGRGKSVPAGSRIGRFQAVLQAAEAIPEYQARLALARLEKHPLLQDHASLEPALAAIPLMPACAYFALFSERKPSITANGTQDETPTVILIPYAEARRGLADSQPYSQFGTVEATSDLYRLSRALVERNVEENAEGNVASWRSDHAVVAFSGVRQGALSDAQRNVLWNRYQVPLFEHFLGADGEVIATECEIHAGLHIRPESALLECVAGEIILTSLTDLTCPALRIQTGLAGFIEHQACDCGRVEPRLMQLRTLHPHQPRTEHTQAAVAVA